MIVPSQGNLLVDDADVLVNTVNCVGVMGKGLALQFKKAWPAMYKDYRAACGRGEVVLGRMHLWQTGRMHGPRFVVNFPTKQHWRSRSRLEDIRTGLQDLRRLLVELGVRSVAVPPLGAGLGGLDWADVRPLIVEALGDLEGIEVRLWEPGSAPPPETRPVRTTRPRWTRARAATIGLMGQYPVLQDELTQVEVQKLAYFLQEGGLDMGMRFQAHRFGPYFDGLYHMLQRMEGHFVVGLQDRSPLALLTAKPDAVREARAWLAGQGRSAQDVYARVSRLIEGFETPFGMELLATVHWVATRDVDDPSDVAEVIRGVHGGRADRGWDRRKRQLMAPRHIEVAWRRLSDEGWLHRPRVAALG